MVPLDTNTLCVVDMQPYFDTQDRVVPNVIQCVKEAMQHDMNIVFLRYYSYGRVDERITNIVRRYPKKITVSKTRDDGGNEFVKAVNHHNMYSNNVSVVGVNRGYCVYDTVLRMLHFPKTISKIYVIADATWGYSPRDELKVLRSLAVNSYGKVKVV